MWSFGVEDYCSFLNVDFFHRLIVFIGTCDRLSWSEETYRDEMTPNHRETLRKHSYSSCPKRLVDPTLACFQKRHVAKPIYYNNSREKKRHDSDRSSAMLNANMCRAPCSKQSNFPAPKMLRCKPKLERPDLFVSPTLELWFHGLFWRLNLTGPMGPIGPTNPWDHGRVKFAAKMVHFPQTAASSFSNPLKLPISGGGWKK